MTSYKKSNSHTNLRKRRRKKENSKKVIDWIFQITILFFIFVSFMMYQTNDLSPVDSMASVIESALKYGIPAYMIRAQLKDKIDMEIMRLEKLNELKQKQKDDFIYEEFDSSFIDL